MKVIAGGSLPRGMKANHFAVVTLDKHFDFAGDLDLAQDVELVLEVNERSRNTVSRG
jgi:hypothetical protein